MQIFLHLDLFIITNKNKIVVGILVMNFFFLSVTVLDFTIEEFSNKRLKKKKHLYFALEANWKIL